MCPMSRASGANQIGLVRLSQMVIRFDDVTASSSPPLPSPAVIGVNTSSHSGPHWEDSVEIVAGFVAKLLS